MATNPLPEGALQNAKPVVATTLQTFNPPATAIYVTSGTSLVFTPSGTPLVTVTLTVTANSWVTGVAIGTITAASSVVGFAFW